MASSEHPRPPSWATRFLSWYCRPDLLEDLEGDLHECFFRNCQARGSSYANFIYVLDVIKFFRVYTIKRPKPGHRTVHLDLVRSYSIAAVRKFLKRKLVTALSLFSLTLGISSFVIISLYVVNEWSFNRHYKNSERIGRISLTLGNARSNTKTNLVWTNPQLPDELRDTYPEIEAVTAVLRLEGKTAVKRGSSIFLEENFFTVDSHYNDVFQHDWLAGDQRTALSEPGRIVLTGTLAHKYFGEGDPLNENLMINNRQYLVSGVIRDVPANTDLRPNALLSVDRAFPDWCMTYVLFGNETGMKEFQEKLDSHFDEYLRPILEQTDTDGYYDLEALTDIHLGDEKLFDAPKADKSALYVFLSIALVILLITVVNYLMMAVAGVAKKISDVGVRKAFGARARQIRLQYVTETSIVVSTAFVLALSTIICAVPVLRKNRILEFYPEQWMGVPFILAAVTFIMVLSTAAGMLPAFLANRGTALSKLKGTSVLGSGRYGHTGFIVIHLTITLSLIFSSGVVTRQVSELLKTDPGYNTKQILVVDIPTDTSVYRLLNHLKGSLSNLSFISGTSLVGPYSVPTNEMGFDIFTVDKTEHESWESINYIQVDEDYFDLLDIQITSGRIFVDSTDSKGSLDEIVVNESLVKAMAWENPLEEYISGRYKVVGVVDNFNFYGLERSPEPLIFRGNKTYPEKMMVKFTNPSGENLQMVKDLWTSEMKGHPFIYRFLDDYFEQHLQKEHTLKYLLEIFSVLAAIIASIGLFGLINIENEQRLKETALRRILGARMADLLAGNVKRYSMAIVIAAMVTFPSTLYLLSLWLEKFAYKSSFDLVTGLKAIAVIGSLGLFAVAYQGVMIIRMKPLNSIRYE